eukprot:CAMPEP_0172441984 /NCGR_PEP_ID=MMETSP1065-20121228/2469_1 /TAXON_ID=265537 /ORGANISM="Amphiprora paludosa, Strain CCMP125" /LENGTH=641 /DNA_ID=CAMNT_0013191625 /DNA_START=333 /DNA_END=2258 /DNA_ORIENTATION=+
MANYHQVLARSARRGNNPSNNSVRQWLSRLDHQVALCRPCRTFASGSHNHNASNDSAAAMLKANKAATLAEIGQRELLRRQHQQQQRLVAVDMARCFSTKVAPSEEDAVGEAGILGNPMSPILTQESDPQRLFASLGMKEEDFYKIAAQTTTSLKLGDMYKYANQPDKTQRMRNAQFLHRELPIRVAQRAVDLLTLPYGLSEAVPIRQVACAYISYCHKMLSTPCPQTYEEEEQFTDLLQSLVLDRTSIPMAVARGLAHWREENQLSPRDLEPERLQEMEDALYRFFTARLGLRFLTEHHVLSCHRESTKDLRKVTHMFAGPEAVSSKEDKDVDYSGCIHSSLDLEREVSRVADLVVQQTQDFYGFAPTVEVVNSMDRKQTGDFTYVPHHLHYMMGELIKNSVRATVRNYLSQQAAVEQKKNESEQNNTSLGALSRAMVSGTSNATTSNTPSPTLAPIRIVIVKGDEDVTIKIADKGGGIPRSKMTKIWKFAHSTADEEESASAFGTDGLSGLKIRGFGLPLCRIYARYLGGDLTLKSMEGYGLDAYLHLPRLGVACENLPRLVRHSPGERDSTPNRNVRNFSTLGINPTKQPWFSPSLTAAATQSSQQNNLNGSNGANVLNHLVQDGRRTANHQNHPAIS